MNKESYWKQKTKAVEKTVREAAASIILAWPKDDKKVPSIEKEIKPSKKSRLTYTQVKRKNEYRKKLGKSEKPFGETIPVHKYAGIEAFNGRTTVMKNGALVPEKRSDRLEYHRESGRYHHKPWPRKKVA